ncbi:hypothetical protein Pint_31337 [Pistacia integerrima]|uniref:Uncharacterized protein n=1 Tax=Pistacia integerrima TaxID=434235 RepID=A0ACC0XSC5_9ROSI|nr:hypothetical protein Pint_31337 [Pistacia integerrima]
MASVFLFSGSTNFLKAISFLMQIAEKLKAVMGISGGIPVTEHPISLIKACRSLKLSKFNWKCRGNFMNRLRYSDICS